MLLKKNKRGGQRKYPVGYGSRSRLYNIFIKMHGRCCNPNNDDYGDYGGRGIAICAEWYRNYQAFFDWSLSNGYASHLTIDRKDNSLGYSPDNCRWVTQQEQTFNTRRNVWITAWNETKTIMQWVKDPRCVMTADSLRLRLKKGVSPEDAMTKTRGAIRQNYIRTHSL